MSYTFEELFNLASEMNKSKNEKCLICHFPIVDDQIKLECTHLYHSKCLNLKKTTKNIKCPYCQKHTNILKSDHLCQFILKSGINKGKLCNRSNCKYHQTNNILPNNICQKILASGKNKGNPCNRHNCKIHS